MRVLLINRDLPPENDSSIIRTMGSIAQELIARGIEVHMLGLTADKSKAGSSLHAGINIHQIFLPKQNPLSYNIKFNRAAKELFIELDAKYSFDIINIHESRLVYSLLKLLDGRRTIYTFHASVAWEYRYDFFKELKANLFKPIFWLKQGLRFLPNYLWLRFAEKSAIQRCSQIHVASHFVADQVKRFYPNQNKKDKIVKIPFGTDYDFFQPTNKSVSPFSENGRAKLLTVRRLVHRMGLEQLITVMTKLPPDYELHIAGKGPLLPRLKQLASKLNVGDRIIFHGFVAESLLPSFYQGADLFILPTEELEGFGLVILEAMAMGTVVVGSDAGAIPEVMAGAPAGSTYHTGDLQDMARVIGQAITSLPAGATEARQAGQKLRDFAMQNFNWKSYVDTFLLP